MRAINLIVNYSTADGEPLIMPQRGDTTFPCGCWLTMDYKRWDDVVDGHLCKAHSKYVSEKYKGEMAEVVRIIPDKELVCWLIEDGILLRGANTS